MPNTYNSDRYKKKRRLVSFESRCNTLVKLFLCEKKKKEKKEKKKKNPVPQLSDGYELAFTRRCEAAGGGRRVAKRFRFFSGHKPATASPHHCRLLRCESKQVVGSRTLRPRQHLEANVQCELRFA
jgi:hypothetical protein